MTEIPAPYLAGHEPVAERLRRMLDGVPDDLAPPAPDSPPARILAAARDLCAEHGFSGLTVRAVAQQAAVNPAMINYYFGSKDRLVDALLTQQVHQLMHDVVSGLDQDAAGEQVLAEFPLRILESFRRDPKRMHLIRVAVSTEPDRLRRIIRSLGEHSVIGVSGVLRGLIVDMQRAGRIAPLPPRSILLFLMANAYGLIFMEQIAREVTGFELDDDRQWGEHRDSLGLLLRHGLLTGEKPKDGAHA